MPVAKRLGGAEMSCWRHQRSRWCSRRGPNETPLSTSARTVRPATSATSTAATAELSAVVSGAAELAHIAMSRSPSTTSSLLHPERMIHQEAAAKFHGARVNLQYSRREVTGCSAIVGPRGRCSVRLPSTVRENCRRPEQFRCLFTRATCLAPHRDCEELRGRPRYCRETKTGELRTWMG